ncbi:MAG: amidohydrolase family protein [Planctomycetaceae bacterium]|nr:amidohydrolase family protein [Planctomycetaceae bacterium]
MIWDLHCHLSGVDGQTPDERTAQLIEYADRMGVERLVFFMGLKWSHEPTPDDLRQQNDEVLQAISHWHDRAFGFAYVSPQHVEASLAEIERCIANGPMVGIKLWVAGKCSDEAIDAIIKRAAELKAVIFQHTWFKVTGNLPGESSPLDLLTLARRHPDVPLICGHTGGDWERGIRAIRSAPNVSIGLGGFDPTAGVTEMAVSELGARRVIYGSDIGGRSFASQLAKVKGADIPDKAKQLILGQNLRRMLLPILREKGINA